MMVTVEEREDFTMMEYLKGFYSEEGVYFPVIYFFF